MSALDEAERYLADAGLLDRPGAVFYSGAETLKPGPAYLIGLNPGGGEGATLRQSLGGSRAGHNCYLDECWAPGGYVQPKGEATLQRRVRHLARMMGLEPRALPGSNLVFTRSPRVGVHDGFAADLDLCLPVHRLFLRTISPGLIFTFGNLLLFSRAFALENVESRPADHGNWQAHRGTARLDGRVYRFANVPHMSIWASDRREHVLRWALEAAE
jgi:hypothetical protein